MQIVIYEMEKIKKLTDYINSMSFNGFKAAKIISEIGDILDSGEIKNREERQK